ncbi:MAG: recombinase family protein [Succiniclasticum sp.]|uniref:recombinase family protein n=1 Tax=Succiniclasticum sp. TaxID=2775030 RepID=UPI002A90A5F2|nr:recombinase family protein [Succiniclasticum sp.]MDY6292159.1 recombinase family protein [Succiniclasticum sp.]
MIYGYARISAKVQLKGNSLEEQKNELRKNGCQIIVEEQFTGKTISRPKFENLILNQLKPGDTLVVTRLDRLARNVTEGVSTIRSLFNKNVRVHVLNVGLLENTAMGNFFITTLLAVAELERCMILERTAAGKEIAKTRDGFKEGRPPIARAKIELAMGLLDEYSYKKVAEMTGISVATLARYRRKMKEEQVQKQFSD